MPDIPTTTTTTTTVPTSTVDTATATSQHQLWNDLSEHLNDWFYKPDLDALKICLCAGLCHYRISEKPLWVCVIGNSGSGKTEILIQTLRHLPDSHIMGAVTPQCFTSSFQKDGRGGGGGGGNGGGKHGKNNKDNEDESSSLLIRYGDSQLWLFKDFTTFASMRYEDRAIVASRLREIWDGQLTSDTGVSRVDWEGKVTVLAVATPEFEDYWAAMRGLGDRFLTLRWRQPDQKGAIAAARFQLGYEKFIRLHAGEIVQQLIGGCGSAAVMPSNDKMKELDALSGIVSQLRVHIVRETDQQRSVIRVPEPEFPMRISTALSQIVRTHMDLFHKDEAGEEEFILARRLALDSIPPARRTILEAISHAPGSRGISYNRLFRQAGLPRTSLRRELENLTMLDVLRTVNPETEGADGSTAETKWGNRITKFSPEFLEKMNEAGLGHGFGPVPVEITKISRRLKSDT